MWIQDTQSTVGACLHGVVFELGNENVLVPSIMGYMPWNTARFSRYQHRLLLASTKHEEGCHMH